MHKKRRGRGKDRVFVFRIKSYTAVHRILTVRRGINQLILESVSLPFCMAHWVF